MTTAEPAPPLRDTLKALRLERPPPPPRRRWRLVAAVAVAAVVVLGLVARRLGGGEVRVETARVTALAAGPEGPVTIPVLSGAGYVVSADRYISVGVRVPGRIDRYLVEEGDHVKAGDPLVELDARDYDAAVRRLEATLASVRAQVVLKRKQLDRARTLAGSRVMSRDELDVRQAEADAAEAAVHQVEADLAAAKVSLEYTTLRAPRSGVILAKLKEVGEIAVPGGFSGSGDLIRMANLEDLRGQVDITESELAKIRMGQRAAVTPDAYPERRYAAHVVKLYPQVDRQKGTLRVEVQIERPDDLLWPDMSARITFLEEVSAPDGTRALVVPRSALRSDGDGSFVWVVREGRARRAAVATGAEFGEQVQVVSGLAGDEVVVVGAPPGLREGAAVRTGS